MNESLQNFFIHGLLSADYGAGGYISRAYAGETYRTDNHSYTVTAVALPGFVFDSWTDRQGNVVSQKPTSTFVMHDGTELHANFVPNPFVAVKGSYRGLVSLNAGNIGLFTLTLTGLGTFSARITTQSTSYAVTGRFDPEGNLFTESKSGTSRGLALSLDLSGNGVSGSLADGSVIASARNVWNATKNPCPEAGRYQCILATDDGNEMGSGTISIGKSGCIAFLARLPDRSRVAQGGLVTANSGYFVFIRIKPIRGSFLGSVAGSLQLNSGQTAGTLIWRIPKIGEGSLTLTTR